MNNPEDMKEFLEAAITATVNVAQPTLAKQFKIHLTQFIAKLIKIYKNIPDQKAAQCISQIAVQANIIEQLSPKTLIVNFHKVAASHFDGVELSREPFMEDTAKNIPLLHSLHISDFWPHIPEETKDSIWKYITKLWNLSAEYNACNDRDKIGGQALDLLQTPRFHTMMQTILGAVATPADDADT